MDPARILLPPPSLDDACALFLDVDGTLIAFAEHPTQVRLLPAVREAVARISHRLCGAVALVSGRPLAQLDALFAPLRLPAAGLHGHELRADTDAPTAFATNTSDILHDLHQRAAHLAHAHPGVWVEDKGSSLALHWRSAPNAGAAMLEFASAQVRLLPDYRLQPGDHVVEFVPAGCDKGRAIEWLQQQRRFSGRRPIFVGDDLTDEYGFAATNRLGGCSVLVGRRADTQAAYCLPDIDAVHAWLYRNAPP